MLSNVWQRHFSWLVLGVILIGLAAGASIAASTQTTQIRTAQPANGLPPVGAAGSSAAGAAPAGNGAQGANASRGAGVTGTIASLDAEALTVQGQDGTTKVKLSGARIVKAVEGSADDLKPGVRVVVTGQQESAGSYVASSIQITPTDQPIRGMPAQSQTGNALGGTRGQGQQDSGQQARTLTGTISAIEPGYATVSVGQGEAKVKITDARIQKSEEGTPQDLKAGQRVVVTGSRGGDGKLESAEIRLLAASDQPARETPGVSQSQP